MHFRFLFFFFLFYNLKERYVVQKLTPLEFVILHTSKLEEYSD